MGVFGDGTKVKENARSITRLEKKVEKVQNSLTSLSSQIETLEKGLPDIVKTHKGQAIRLGQLKSSIEVKVQEMLDIYNSVQNYKLEINELLQKLKSFNDESENLVQTSNATTKELIEKMNDAYSLSQETVESVKHNADTVISRIEEFNEIINKYPELEEELVTAEENIENSKELLKRGKVLHTETKERKDEIDTIYFEIVGYSDEDDLGEEKIVEGLKGKLQRQYEQLKKDLQQLDTDVEKGLIASSKQTETVIESWEEKYKNIEQKITDLLPAALTAGLSSAYADKKKEETNTYQQTQNLFYKGIMALGSVSIVPIIISSIFIYQGISLHAVIERAPKLVIAILPLYIPALWLAYAANKQLNLSKRLIEEYTHKEVQSRTYEGLSAQINSLNSSDESINLKIRLLQNVLAISSENPGKLISDYNKTDHPIMDVLEKSLRYENALERTQRIPGLNKLVSKLKNRVNEESERQAKKIDKAISDKTDDIVDEIIKEN